MILKKKAAAVLIPLIIFTSFPVIAQIKVIGNDRINIGFINSTIKNEREENKVLKTLYATNLFSDIKVTHKGGDLIIQVVENPIVNEIILNGNKKVKESKILEAIKTKPHSILNKNQLDKDVKSLELLYKVKGRGNTKIELVTENIGENKVNLRFNIKEGGIYKIRAIKFTGNDNISNDKLQQILYSKQVGLYRIFGTSHYFIKERLEIDKDLISKYYLSKGYFNVNVQEAEVTIKGSAVFINFIIDEGKLQKFGKIKIEGNTGNIPSNSSSLSEAQEGNTFSLTKVNSTISNIKNLLIQQGYPFVQVIPDYKVGANDTIDVVFRVIESSKAYINRINIEGNNNTLDKVIRRVLPFAEDDIYDPTKLAQAKQAVLNLGFFNNVEVNNKVVDDNKVDVNVGVKEKGTGLINLGVNYRSDVGVALSIAVSEYNLFGEGNELNLAIKKARKYLESSISFVKPHIFDTDITASTSLFTESQQARNEISFDNSSSGIKFNFSYNLTKNLSNAVYYSYNYNNIYNLKPTASQIIKEQEGKSIISLLGYIIAYNTLDNYASPTSGYIIRGNQGISGLGGNLYFLKSEASGAIFKELGKSSEIIAQLNTRVGYIKGYNGQQVKVGQRFFMYDMRGFEPTGLGPRDAITKDSLGGNFFLLSTAQTEFPIGLPKELNIKGSIFIDVGTVTGIDKKNPNIQDSAGLRASFGAGITWKSPMGPIRFDIGIPILKEDYDTTNWKKISIGNFI